MPITLNSLVRDRALGAAHSGNVSHDAWIAPAKRSKGNCIGRDSSQAGKADEWKYPVFSADGKLNAKGVDSAMGYAETDAPGLVDALRAISTAIKSRAPAIAASADSFVLCLDGPVSESDVKGLPAMNAEGLPIHYRKAVVAKVGEWVNRKDGSTIKITPERVNEWCRNTAAIMAKGVKPFIPDRHTDVFGAEANYGYVERLELNGDDVCAILALHGDDALKIASRNGRSIYVVKDARDSYGAVYPGETLKHVALTPNPNLPDLGEMVKIAASADHPSKEIPVFELSVTDSPLTGGPMAQMFTPAHLDRVKAVMKKHKMDPASATMDNGIDHCMNCAEGNPLSLSADEAKTLTAERDDAKMQLSNVTNERDAAVTEAKLHREKVLSLSADRPNPDPLTLSMFSENISAKRDMAISSGAISEPEAKHFDAMLSDASGSPNVLALSACGPDRKPFAFKFWDVMSKLGANAVRTGTAVTRETTPLPLGLSGDQTTPGRMSAERRRELALDPIAAASSAAK